MVDLLDALELDRAHLVGNCMGGRIALETGLNAPDRVGRVVLLCPAVAWLRERPLGAASCSLVRPELGLIQPTPRPVVEGIVRRLIPGATDDWAAAGVDEFLRSYLTPRGRAAFYAAARNIYLDEPGGDERLLAPAGRRSSATRCSSGASNDGLVPAVVPAPRRGGAAGGAPLRARLRPRAAARGAARDARRDARVLRRAPPLRG